ncbi:MAG: hypothetical protein K0Q49_1555 [Haloplasmataceae bacterium]|nr:hypothetical protein [Haloplasmataceae bacterium]
MTVEIKNQIRKKLVHKVNLENDLLTKYNVDAYVLKIKNLIKSYKSISKVEEFPFRELFTKVIVESRDNIIFIIGKRDNFSDMDFDNSGILNGEITYSVRKTHFKTSHNILFL